MFKWSPLPRFEELVHLCSGPPLSRLCYHCRGRFLIMQALDNTRSSNGTWKKTRFETPRISQNCLPWALACVTCFILGAASPQATIPLRFVFPKGSSRFIIPPLGMSSISSPTEAISSGAAGPLSGLRTGNPYRALHRLQARHSSPSAWILAFGSVGSQFLYPVLLLSSRLAGHLSTCLLARW